MASPQPNPSLGPPNGYRFTDHRSGLLFAGSDWEDVIAKVRNYRKANKIPIGDPRREVFDQFCTHYPTHCRGTVQIDVTSSSNKSLPQRVTEWLTGLLRSKRAKASEKEAYRRMEICSKCPAQANWWSGCGGCNEGVVKVRTEIFRRLGMKKIDLVTESHLQGCLVLGIDTATAVWIDDLRSRPGAPEHCWLRQL